MQAIIVIILCLAAAAYVIHSSRKDRLVVRDYHAVTAALAPGPRIREMTTVSPRRLANGSRPVFTPELTRRIDALESRVRSHPTRGLRVVSTAADPEDFSHVDTDYGMYTPADVDMAAMARADTELHHASPTCAEAQSHDTFGCGHHDTSYGDSSYGDGFDGGGHHGH